MSLQIRKTKAQVHTEIFIYVLGAIIFALVLLYGYKSIKELRAKGELVELLRARADLEAKVNAMRTESGSVRSHELYLPAKYTRVCFVDMSKAYSIFNAGTNLSSLGSISPEASIAVESKKSGIEINKNIFLVPQSPVEMYVPNLVVADPFWYCANMSQGRLQLRLEGLGKEIRVGPWS